MLKRTIFGGNTKHELTPEEVNEYSFIIIAIHDK